MMDLDWDDEEEFTVPHLGVPKSAKREHLLEYVRNASREIASLPNTKVGKAVRKQLSEELKQRVRDYTRKAVKAVGRSR